MGIKFLSPIDLDTPELLFNNDNKKKEYNNNHRLDFIPRSGIGYMIPPEPLGSIPIISSFVFK